MMQRLFENTVSALCYEIGRENSGGEPLFGPPYNDVAAFVRRQIDAMPFVLGMGVRVATILFSLAAIPRNLKVFHRAERERRRVQIAIWSASKLSPCRDLMKLYTSLVLLVLYSRKDDMTARLAG